MDVKEKIQKAKTLKEEGNAFFKNQDVKSALRQYHFAWLNIKGLGENAMSLAGPGGGGESSLDEDEKAVMKTLTESLHLNLAACYLKTEKYDRCIASCTTAIATNENSAKAYFRRGQAHLKVHDADNAEKDLRKAASLAPGDAAIKKEMQKVMAERKRQNQKQAKTFKGFFDKIDLYDEKEGLETKKAKMDEEEQPEEKEEEEKKEAKPTEETVVVPPVENEHSEVGRPD